jgi:hypothetical protein
MGVSRSQVCLHSGAHLAAISARLAEAVHGSTVAYEAELIFESDNLEMARIEK